MKYRTMIFALLLALALTACGDDDESSNNANSVNNTNNVNNTINNTNNASNTNNVNNTNNANNTNNINNTNNVNNTNNAGVDFIVADVDGTTVRAESAEGGVEPMAEFVQLRKTTADQGDPSTLIYRLSIPNTDVASYDCANDDVTVTYSQLDGQLITNWIAEETCTIEVTQGHSNSGDVIQGTFTATATDGNTSIELTNGEFSLTR